MAGRIIEFTFKGDARDLDKALAGIRGESEATGDSLEETGKEGTKGLTSVAKSGDLAKKSLKVMAGAAAAATAVVVGLALSVVSLSDDLNILAKSAKEVGSTTEEIDELQGTFDLLTRGGVNAARAVQDFQRNLADARDGAGEADDELAKLGLGMEDIAGLPLPQAIALVSSRFGRLQDAADKSQVAMAIFGRSGRQLVPALDAGGAAMEAASAAIRETGLVSSEAAAQGEALQDSLLLMGRQADNLKRDSLGQLLPALTDLADFAADAISSFDRRALVSFIGTLSDLTSGVVLAARAWRLLGTSQRDADAASREAAQDAINKQSERIVGLKEQLRVQDEATKSASQLTGFEVERTARGRELNIQIERQIEVLQRLKGELGEEAGLITAEARALRASAAARRDSTTAAEEQLERFDQRNEAIVFGIELQDLQRGAELEGLDEIAAKWAEVGAKERAEIQRTAAARRQANADALSAAGTLTSSLSSLAFVVLDAVVDSTEEGTKARKKAAMAAFVIQKVAAIAEAGVATALAVVNSLKVGLPVGAILAVAAGIAGGVAIAAIAATPKPSFHDGGMIDEVNIRALGTEGIVNTTGARALGGQEGLDQLNRGIVPNGGSGGEQTIVFKMGHKVVDAQTSSAVKRTGSPLDSALRATNPRGTGRRNPYQGRT